MGSVISYLLSWVTPAPQYDPTPDPTTGLTQKDREIITQTWALVSDKKVVKKNALEFFMQLFQSYPYLQDAFPLFKKKSIEELRNSPKMKAHATSVFYTITSFVENLEDTENLVGLIQKMAVAHIDRGLKVQDFDNLRLVLLKFVKSLLGSQCTPEIESAWNKLLLAQNAVYKMTMDEKANHK